MFSPEAPPADRGARTYSLNPRRGSSVSRCTSEATAFGGRLHRIRSRSMPFPRLAAAALSLAALALIVAGCGGSSSSSSSSNSGSSSGTAATVSGASDPELGMVLVDSEGFTVYSFAKDKGTTSSCYGACAEAWPPVTAKGKPVSGEGAMSSESARRSARTARFRSHTPATPSTPSSKTTARVKPTATAPPPSAANGTPSMKAAPRWWPPPVAKANRVQPPPPKAAANRAAAAVTVIDPESAACALRSRPDARCRRPLARRLLPDRASCPRRSCRAGDRER